MNEHRIRGVAPATPFALLALVTVGLLTALFAACGAAPDTAAGTRDGAVPTQGRVERIGTYDGRAVVIAYANSDLFRQWIGAIKQQHDTAEAAGEHARAAELAAAAQAQQDRFHGQAFDGDRIDDVLERVAADIPAICRQAGVARLEAVNVARSPDVETVDVTDQLVELFHPDERARGWIADIRGKPFPK